MGSGRRLTVYEIERLKRLKAAGLSHAAIARAEHVDYGTVCRHLGPARKTAGNLAKKGVDKAEQEVQ